MDKIKVGATISFISKSCLLHIDHWKAGTSCRTHTAFRHWEATEVTRSTQLGENHVFRGGHRTKAKKWVTLLKPHLAVQDTQMLSLYQWSGSMKTG